MKYHKKLVILCERPGDIFEYLISLKSRFSFNHRKASHLHIEEAKFIQLVDQWIESTLISSYVHN